MVFAKGCWEGCSRQAAKINSPSSSISASTRISVTTGFPSVSVPVLSSTTVFTFPSVSSASADLIKIPCSAPLPVPTKMATGVASPSAQGQEITNTATPAVSAFVMSCPPKKNHNRAVINAMDMTTGTNTPATLSASFAMGALEAAASSTSRIICARVVSSPTRVASIKKDPD